MNTSPRACKKGSLYKKLSGINEKKIAPVIWDAIMERRKCTLEQAKREQVLYKPEVETVLRYFGEID